MDPQQDIDLIGVQRFKRIGVCIYCRDAASDLSDEHIVPYALNGNWILPKASCA
jgi:5-methylcytosine-specific restriction endonuclease McrA